MQVTKNFICQYKSLLQHFLPICIKANFQQRIVEKYRRSLELGLELPNLLFLRNSRHVSMPNQKTLISAPVHIALIIQVLKTQNMVRETISCGKPIHIQMPTSNTSIASTTIIRRCTVPNVENRQDLSIEKLSSISWYNTRQPYVENRQDLSIEKLSSISWYNTRRPYVENRQDLSIEKLSSISWHNMRRSLSLSIHEDLFIRSVINSKKMQIIPVAIIGDQIDARRSFSKMETPAERSDEFNSNVRIHKPGGLPGVRQHGQSVIIHKAGLPLELSYLPPAATTLAKPVFQPGQHNGESTFSERPQADIHPVPKTSHAGSLDLNRLTDQVYQVLERKIRLEKQRRGYR
jgi:hypothetical protein